jgi:hypothetical protein
VPSFDYSKNIISLSTGASYASVDLAWPASYSVAVDPAAITEINSAAGGLFSVVFKPFDYNVPQNVPLPRFASIDSAVLQLTPAVPEPAEWAMLMFGLFALGFAVRARRA